MRLVVSDSHAGLVKTIRKVMFGAGWRRCRVHFTRDRFAVFPKGTGEMAVAAIRTTTALPGTANG